MLNDLHRTDDIELLRFLYECLSSRMLESECPRCRRRCYIAREIRIRGGMTRRVANVLCRGVDGERIGTETRETLLEYEQGRRTTTVNKTYKKKE